METDNFFFNRSIKCIGCGKITKLWIWLQGKEGECEECFYKRHGLPNPRPDRKPDIFPAPAGSPTS